MPRASKAVSFLEDPALGYSSAINGATAHDGDNKPKKNFISP